MQQTLHLYLYIQNELPTVEELSQRGFRVEFPWYIDIDLLGDFLELYNPVLLHQAVGWRAV